ncbi:MAG: YgcG family protein [Rhodocyclaceae bacterium]|nr:YgcG family protein [Rhodocyclaceae bacterium]MDZ4214357.1 YgcG family protein [Rhodocyclaceae bacterium]
MALPRLAWLFLCLALWLIVSMSGARADVAVPPLTARVTDLTATLSASDKTALEADLQALEARSGAQVAVLLVPTTQPESIEQYSIRVVEAWQLGRKGEDDGVLLLVAKDDRKLRIEVGYGLEGRIPDVVAFRIIDQEITPRFKQGDFAGGIRAGTARIAALIEGQESPDASVPDSAPSGPDPFEDIPAWLLLVIVGIGSILRWVIGPLLGGLVMGGLVGGTIWFLTGALPAALFAALFAFVFFLVGLGNWISLAGSGKGGGSSGGGFSGGGGGFGGGGASGSW